VTVTSRQLGDAADLLDRLLRLQAIYRRVPGMAYGLSHGAATVRLGGYGVADLATAERIDPSSTTFRCASITKSFTATIVLRLVERRKLRLDDPVAVLLPWTRPALDANVTVRHLLMHAASMIRDGSNDWEGPRMPDRTTVRSEVLAGGTFGEPSERFRYSNVAYALLGEIAERVSGRPFDALVRREVAAPLGLRSTWSDLTPTSARRLATGYFLGRPGEAPVAAPQTETRAIAPAGGLVSSVPDLLAYQQAHLPSDDRLLSAYSKREMQRAQWQRGSEPHYGLGWMTWHSGGMRVVGHSGGFPGFITKIGFVPDEGLAAAVLTNAQSPMAPEGLETIFHTVATVSSWWDRAAFATRFHTRASLSRFAGVYRSRGSDLVVGRVNGSLVVLDGQDPLPFENGSLLAPVGALRFKVVDGYDFGFVGEEFRFERDRSGRVTTLHFGAHRCVRES
jgi:CubicO group peptidase (beta-lactamase class C family)